MKALITKHFLIIGIRWKDLYSKYLYTAQTAEYAPIVSGIDPPLYIRLALHLTTY